MTVTIIFKDDDSLQRIYHDHYPVINTHKTHLIIRNMNTNLNDDVWDLKAIKKVMFEP